jgi:hypothetical protein
MSNRTPIEQIEYIRAINAKALTRDVQNDIKKLIDSLQDDEYVYKKGVLRPK